MQVELPLTCTRRRWLCRRLHYLRQTLELENNVDFLAFRHSQEHENELAATKPIVLVARALQTAYPLSMVVIA
jgi:hypothetical protein